MSEAIADAGRTLRELLRAQFPPGERDGIRLISPADATGQDVRISVFLYSVVENAFLKNEDRRPRRGSDGRVTPGDTERAPLTVDLLYLLTAHPLGGTATDNSTEDSHVALARAMRVFYERSIVRGQDLQGVLREQAVELRIQLNPMSVEEMTRIWSVFPDQAYRPSVGYQVTPVPIRVTEHTEALPVIERRAEHGHLLAERSSP